MIDPKLLRNDPEGVARNLARRGFTLDVAAYSALEAQRRTWQVETDRLRAARNAHAKAVGAARGRGEDIAPLVAQGEALARDTEAADARLTAVQAQLDTWVMGLPNLLDAAVPEGHDETANVEVRRWGEPRPCRSCRATTSTSASACVAWTSRAPGASPARASS